MHSYPIVVCVNSVPNGESVLFQNVSSYLFHVGIPVVHSFPIFLQIHLPSFSVQDMVRSGLAGVVKVGKVMLGSPMLNSPALAYSLPIYSLITFIVLVNSSVLVQVLLVSYTCSFSSWHVPWNLICTMCA